jgi:hypothetical protein
MFWDDKNSGDEQMVLDPTEVKFCEVVRQMLHHDPNQRPTARQLLERLAEDTESRSFAEEKDEVEANPEEAEFELVEEVPGEEDYPEGVTIGGC